MIPEDPPSALPRPYFTPDYTSSSSSGSESEFALKILTDAKPLKKVPDPKNLLFDEVEGDREVQVGLAPQRVIRAHELCHRTAEGEEATENEPPEPLEGPIGYPGILKDTRTDLGWYSKMNRSHFNQDFTLAFDAALNMSIRLEKLAEDMNKYQSYRNRKLILTIIRKIILSCINTGGSEIAKLIHANDFHFDKRFVTALQTMTPGQRRRLRNENGGLWVLELLEVIRQARRQNLYPKLHVVLSLLDPIKATAVEPWGDGGAA
ncbi:hypothetical protein PG997_007502 [Apiospora hydei]|uniref:Uncharacterized protein n=1 Tax=Apiospora hydei TaxID=1337664 RepID=A0ABR1WBZ1_9PEZI